MVVEEQEKEKTVLAQTLLEQPGKVTEAAAGQREPLGLASEVIAREAEHSVSADGEVDVDGAVAAALAGAVRALRTAAPGPVSDHALLGRCANAMRASVLELLGRQDDPTDDPTTTIPPAPSPMTRLAGDLAAARLGSDSPAMPLTRQATGFATLPFPLATSATPATAPPVKTAARQPRVAVFGKSWSPQTATVSGPEAPALAQPLLTTSPVAFVTAASKSWATPSTVGGLSRALGSTPSDGSPGTWSGGTPHSWGNGPAFPNSSPGGEFGVESSPGAGSRGPGSPDVGCSHRLSNVSSSPGDRRLSIASTVARC